MGLGWLITRGRLGAWLYGSSSFLEPTSLKFLAFLGRGLGFLEG